VEVRERKTTFQERLGAIIQIVALLSFVGMLAADALLPAFQPWRWALLGLLGMAWGAKPEAFGQLLTGIRIVREDRRDRDDLE
jgi:hypothetical protein